jgi:WD40 repeat protein
MLRTMVDAPGQIQLLTPIKMVTSTFHRPSRSEGVVCVTWSRTGYYLASASENGDICLWNVLENRVQARLQVEWPVTRISLSRWAGLPNQRWHVAVSFAGMWPMVYDFHTQKRYPVHLFVLGASCLMMWRCWGGWGCDFGRVW